MAEPLIMHITRHMWSIEEALGRTPVRPDNAPRWFKANDWWPWPVLAVDDDAAELHILCLEAKRQRRGGLTRLLDAARLAPLTPVIVQPTGLIMPMLLKRWNWTRADVDYPTIGDKREEWRP